MQIKSYSFRTDSLNAPYRLTRAKRRGAAVWCSSPGFGSIIGRQFRCSCSFIGSCGRRAQPAAPCRHSPSRKPHARAGAQLRAKHRVGRLRATDSRRLSRGAQRLGYLRRRCTSGRDIETAIVSNAASVRKSRQGLSEVGEMLAATGTSSRNPHQALAPCQPDVSLFPFEIWDRLSRVWRCPPRTLSMHIDPCGYGPLREALCAYLRTARMIECVRSRILITTGARNGIHLAARLLLNAGDHVWVENPGHIGLRTALTAAGATVVPMPVDDQGLSFAKQKKTARSPRMIAVAPSHQYPLGTVMSLERRLSSFIRGRNRQLDHRG